MTPYHLKPKYTGGRLLPPVTARTVRHNRQSVKEINFPDGRVTCLGQKLFRKLYDKEEESGR